MMARLFSLLLALPAATHAQTDPTNGKTCADLTTRTHLRTLYPDTTLNPDQLWVSGAIQREPTTAAPVH
jgi:hypothetical protein